MTFTRDERKALCDTFAGVGPDHPTLAGHWTTHDLVAHLLVRERRPDAALGIVVAPLSGHTEKVRRQLLAQPYHELVDRFRSGPPVWSFSAIPIVGDWANLFEYYVHHEDIRRAEPDWAPRPHDQAREDALWSGLASVGRFMFRRAPVGVVLAPAGRDEVTARTRPRSVRLVGEPSEIALVAFGRPSHATRVVIQGDHDDVVAFESSKRGL